MSTNSMFNPNRNSGGGGSGGNVNVINNLNSTSTSSALSANMGRVLNETILAHEKMIASETQLGHVKIDGTTITIKDGVISSTGGNGSGSVVYAQAILSTTIVDQQTWKIPFPNYKYPDDLLIVTHNSTVVDTNNYSITQNADGVSWDVNIPLNPLYSRPIDENVVFVIMVKGASGGSGGTPITVEDVLTSTSTLNALSANMGRELKNLLDIHEQVRASKTILGHVKIDDSTIKMTPDGEIYAENVGEITKLESYQKVLETTTVGQKEWIIPLQSFDPDNDTIIVSHNTTLLTDEMYEIYTDGSFKGVRILENLPSAIASNNVFVIILQNVIVDGTNMISGSIIIDKTITEDKLSQDVQDKINLRTIRFEEIGDVITGDKEATSIMPFSCLVKTFELVLATTSVNPMEINIQESADFLVWENILPTNIIVPANTHISTLDVATDVLINKGKVVRLSIVNTIGDAKNLSINMNVQTK